MATRKAFPVPARQAGPQIHMRESLLVVDELIDGFVADCVSWNLVGDPAGDLLGAPPRWSLSIT